jgi:hypothetical protein
VRSQVRFAIGMAAVLAVSTGMLVAAEEAAKDSAAHKNAAPVPGPKPHRGILADKPADAAAGVVAVLNVKQHKEGDAVFSIITSDEALAKKIADLKTKGGKVVVKGDVTADGKGINAVSIEEAVAHRPAEKAPKADAAAAPAVPAVAPAVPAVPATH